MYKRFVYVNMYRLLDTSTREYSVLKIDTQNNSITEIKDGSSSEGFPQIIGTSDTKICYIRMAFKDLSILDLETGKLLTRTKLAWIDTPVGVVASTTSIYVIYDDGKIITYNFDGVVCGQFDLASEGYKLYGERYTFALTSDSLWVLGRKNSTYSSPAALFEINSLGTKVHTIPDTQILPAQASFDKGFMLQPFTTWQGPTIRYSMPQKLDVYLATYSGAGTYLINESSIHHWTDFEDYYIGCLQPSPAAEGTMTMSGYTEPSTTDSFGRHAMPFALGYKGVDGKSYCAVVSVTGTNPGDCKLITTWESKSAPGTTGDGRVTVTPDGHILIQKGASVGLFTPTGVQVTPFLPIDPDLLLPIMGNMGNFISSSEVDIPLLCAVNDPSQWPMDPDFDDYTWQEVPSSLHTDLQDPMLASDGKFIYIFNTYNETDFTDKGRLCYKYDPITDVYMELAHSPIERLNTNPIVYQDKIYIFGGYNDIDPEGGDYLEYLASCTVYDIKTDSWESIPDMPRTRAWYTPVLHGDKIYCFSGDSFDGMEPVMDIYDIDTQEWATEETPYSLSNYFATVLGDDIYYGDGINPEATLDVVQYVYNVTTHTWREEPSKPVRRTSGGCGILLNKVIHLLGDAIDNITRYESYSFNPTSKEWLRLPDFDLPGELGGPSAKVSDCGFATHAGAFYFYKGGQFGRLVPPEATEPVYPDNCPYHGSDTCPYTNPDSIIPFDDCPGPDICPEVIPPMDKFLYQKEGKLYTEKDNKLVLTKTQTLSELLYFHEGADYFNAELISPGVKLLYYKVKDKVIVPNIKYSGVYNGSTIKMDWNLQSTLGSQFDVLGDIYSDDKVLFLISNDQGSTWQTFDGYSVLSVSLDTISSTGMSTDTLTGLTKSQLDTLKGNTNQLRLAIYLEQYSVQGKTNIDHIRLRY